MAKYVPKDLDAIYQELIADNDRAKAIVGGAYLDAALAEILKRQFRKLSSDDEDKLFSPSGPYGSCSYKIQAVYALDLCGPKTKKDLERINKIRNMFAHDMNPASFDDQEIVKLCRELHSGADHQAHAEGNWRQKFVDAIQLLSHDLLIKERHEHLLD